MPIPYIQLLWKTWKPFYFFNSQHRREETNMTQKSVMDFRVSEYRAQSESAKPHDFKALEEENMIPLAGQAFKYLGILVSA